MQSPPVSSTSTDPNEQLAVLMKNLGIIKKDMDAVLQKMGVSSVQAIPCEGLKAFTQAICSVSSGGKKKKKAKQSNKSTKHKKM